MNKKLGMAVAGAVMAFGATAANAGITIPAGDWTIDIGGNVNAYYTYTDPDKNPGIAGGLASGGSSDKKAGVETGLLPAFLAVSGKTRQNDLDIGFTISINPGIRTGEALSSAGQENRQAFLTFGDASWGTIKAGRDLGIYASDAILSDMTLLGVGAGAGGVGNGTTTLGHIGTGYLYADWKAQISYWSPNWNGFSFAVGIMEPWQAKQSDVAFDADVDFLNSTVATGTSGGNNENLGFEGKASYEWTGDVSGKVWAGFISQKVDKTTQGGITSNIALGPVGTNVNLSIPLPLFLDEIGYGGDTSYDDSYTARGWDIGAKVNFAGFDLLAYYYDGKGIGTTGFLVNGADLRGKRRDSDGYFLQAMYTLPNFGTKIGVSYGESKLEKTSTDKEIIAALTDNDLSTWNLVEENNQWTVGVYHPLTKSLNLVAEYSNVESKAMDSRVKDVESDTLSLGAILFF